jgi:tetratricopeptide (TPR) repeat protein
MIAAALVVSLTLIPCLPASALENTPVENLGPGTDAAPPASREAKLDALFATLKIAPNVNAARKAESEIIALWLQSGSDTIDLLMTWSGQAIEQKEYSRALDLLDRVVTLQPDYAEGWNKRATVYYLTDRYSQSIADIERVLVIEPRHFGALSGLGSIFREIGDKKRAIEAYDQALELDPYLENVRKALEELGKDSGGTDI